MSDFIELNKNQITGTLYIDHGNGFHEKETVPIVSEQIMPGKYKAHYIYNHYEGVKALRFDPVAMQPCVLYNISVQQNGEILEARYSDNFVYEKSRIMLTDNPWILINNIEELGPIVIDVEFIVVGDEYVKLLHAALLSKLQTNSELEQKNASIIANMNDLQESYRVLKVKCDRLKADVDAYVTLVNKKDELLIGYEKKIDVKIFLIKCKKIMHKIVRKLIKMKKKTVN